MKLVGNLRRLQKLYPNYLKMISNLLTPLRGDYLFRRTHQCSRERPIERGMGDNLSETIEAAAQIH